MDDDSEPRTWTDEQLLLTAEQVTRALHVAPVSMHTCPCTRLSSGVPLWRPQRRTDALPLQSSHS